MLASTHLLSGAVIGSFVSNPVKAFTLGFASHFILDAIPHWGNFPSYNKYLKIAVIDGLSLIVLTGALHANSPKHKRLSILSGALGAVFPDFDKPSVLFFKKDPYPVVMQNFHKNIQTEHYRLFFVDGLVFASCAFILSSVNKSI
jgi:hypothetical protein